MSVLEVRDLVKSFGGVVAVDDINFDRDFDEDIFTQSHLKRAEAVR